MSCHKQKKQSRDNLSRPKITFFSGELFGSGELIFNAFKGGELNGSGDLIGSEELFGQIR